MTTTPTPERFVTDEKRTAIHDTERDLYFGVLSVKTARLFTHEFNKPGHGIYADIVFDTDDDAWVSNDDPKLNEAHESIDFLFDLAVAEGFLTPEEIAIANGEDK